jgi:hypothetical protein
LRLFVLQDICYGKFVTHFEWHMTRRILSREKRTKNWSFILHVNHFLGIYSRHEDAIININIYIQHEEEFQECAYGRHEGMLSHDVSWRRINNELSTMNHTSEKSKWVIWHRDTECDGEGQVGVWIRGIKLAMESDIFPSVNLYWIIKKRWPGQEVKYWSYNVKIHCHRLKVDLLKSRSCWYPQSLTKRKTGIEENQVDKLKIIHKCFHLLEYRL